MGEIMIKALESSDNTMSKPSNARINRKGAPLFSVAVLHYKQPEYWKEAVLSVLEQDYPAIQLIFSDDGTPDFDVKVVESFIMEHRTPNLVDWQVYTSTQNRGTAANCDSAVAHSSGEYILLLDGDDALADASVLTRFVDEFHLFPEDANIVAANGLLCDDKMENGILMNTAESIRKLNAWTAEEQYKNIYHYFFPVPSATAFKRRVFALYGGFQAPYGQLEPKESLQYLAMKHTNEQLRLTSRSGGIFAAVAQRVLKEGGTVYGAAFDQELRVCHRGSAAR